MKEAKEEEAGCVTTRCHYITLLMPHTLDRFVCADSSSFFLLSSFTACYLFPASSSTSLTRSHLHAHIHAATRTLQRSAGAPRYASGGEHRSAELLCLSQSLSLRFLLFIFHLLSAVCVCVRVRVFANLFPFLGCLLAAVSDSPLFSFFSSFRCLVVRFLRLTGAHTHACGCEVRILFFFAEFM